MKNINFKSIVLLTLFVSVLTSCVKDDDFAIPALKSPFYSEDFQAVQHNTILDLPNWTNFAELGTMLWFERVYQGDGYAQFSSFGGGNATNVAWLISPTVDLTAHQNVKFSFQSAQNFVSDDANKLEVYVSTNYNGTSVGAATWTNVNPNVANKNTMGYKFIPSGEIDLSAYESQGQINIAFKVTGSGTNTNLDGLFQVNNLFVYTSK